MKRINSVLSTERVFNLPSIDGSNKMLLAWIERANLNKHITWHCARLSFSILLQDKRVDAATVALLLGHSSTRYVDRVYKRHRPKDIEKTLENLPAPIGHNGYFRTCYPIAIESDLIYKSKKLQISKT